jgi:hypothetical protein
LNYEIKELVNRKTQQGLIVFSMNHNSGVFGYTGGDKGGDRLGLLIVRPFPGFVLMDP